MKTTKICSKCKIDKDRSLFHFRNKALGLIQSVCKQCVSENQKLQIRASADYSKIESLDNEIWLVFPNDNKYSVSNLGRIKSHISIGYRHREYLLRVQKTKKGYLSVVLSKKRMQLHRIVAIAFIPNPLNKEQVNHKDGNKTNNYVSNLEWCTNAENMRHSWKTGIRTEKSIAGLKYIHRGTKYNSRLKKTGEV